MQRPGLEPETPTWQAGTLPNYANAACPVCRRSHFLRCLLDSQLTRGRFELPLQELMGQEGFEPSCTSYPFNTLSE